MTTEYNTDSLQTGDIILFMGNWWYSWLLEKFGRSAFSHCGLVLRDPTYIDPELRGLYILQSGFGFPPDINGNVRSGVQINKLEDILQMYKPGEVFVRHLTAIRDDRFYKILASIYCKHGQDSYDFRFTDWIEAKIALDSGWETAQSVFSRNNARNNNEFWCSAFLAFIFYRLGLFEDPELVPYTLISPRDWSTKSNVLKFKACVLGTEIKL